MTVDLLAFVAIDTGFHPVGVSEGGGGLARFNNKGDLPAVAVTGVVC